MDARWDRRPVRRVVAGPDAPAPGSGWPLTIPAVSQVLATGLDLPAGVTLLIGENGSGKSTLVEAIAMAYGLSPEGGSIHARHSTRRTESDLHAWLRLERSAGAKKWGFFVRAETMHGFYSYLADNPGTMPEPDFHALSHGESFLALLRTRFDSPGFYVLDEPESGLSFSAQVALVGTLSELAQEGAQVLCATHSPLLAAIPGATVLEVGPWGLRQAAYDDLEVVGHWRAYLADPMRYLRHVL
ncbi:AAA family ATPase [Nocardioides currus]|uniref:AAA family ATPase n=1 Tax=Nocardioides currus TaxID=2133958 RepID=A0A2R7Z2Q1_9ACTN|nr:AAA family ATPase [Nocardioides currus]PUA82913.1 AAA family ATPase [Nocardioides currus]